MGHHASKMQGLVLPCQGGKTRKAINIINKRYMEIAELARASGVKTSESDLNIWISANNKMLVKQTEARMSDEIRFEDSESDSDDEKDADATIENHVFSWMSGTKSNNVTAEHLALEILNDNVEMIVMCSNGIRLRYLNSLLKFLSRNKHFSKKITVWIDEADVSICSWRKYPEVLEMKQLTQVILITATPTAIIKEYESLQIIPYECTFPEVYRYLTHAECIEVTYQSDISMNLMNIILAKGNDDLHRPGARAFIPGNFDKDSHEVVSATLLEFGFIVIILNGTHKEVRFPEGEGNKIIDLKPYMTTHGTETPEEFNETLALLYAEHGMDRYPLAITGCLCVERGITFQSDSTEEHNGFIFDYGIIPHIPNAATAYQTMARLFGNIGHFSNYKPSKIYCNAKTFEKVRQGESIAINLPRIMFETGQRVATMETLVEAANYEKDKNYDLIQEEFDTLEEANDFLSEHGFIKSKKRIVEASGFMRSSLTSDLEILSYDKVIAAQRGWSKTSNLADAVRKGKGRRLYVCYRDLNDPTSVVYIVRILKTK